MTRRFNKILAAIMAILIVTATGCTAQNNTVNSNTNSNTTTSATESSVPETEKQDNSSVVEDNVNSEVTTTTTSQTETSVPETEIEDVTSEVPETENNTSVPETPASDEVSVPETEIPETTTVVTTSDVPETQAPEPETTPPPVTEVPETTTTTTTIIKPETPAPKWTETECNKTMYVNTSCYSRKEAIMGAQTVKLYNVNDKVTVIATTDTGYGKLNDGTFIHQDYLSDSKVAETTTTTTTKPQETPEPEPFKSFVVYTNKDNALRYSDAECTNLTGGFNYLGTEVTVIGESDISYKIGENKYIKKTDVQFDNPIDEIFFGPFDIEAIRQYIIDDAVNNYGLVLNEKMNSLEGTTWFSPTRIYKDLSPAHLSNKVAGMVSRTIKMDSSFGEGDTFNIYIVTSPDGDAYDLYLFRGGN